MRARLEPAAGAGSGAGAVPPRGSRAEGGPTSSAPRALASAAFSSSGSAERRARAPARSGPAAHAAPPPAAAMLVLFETAAGYAIFKVSRGAGARRRGASRPAGRGRRPAAEQKWGRRGARRACGGNYGETRAGVRVRG